MSADFEASLKLMRFIPMQLKQVAWWVDALHFCIDNKLINVV
jgi:hypothetical protein